MTNRPEQPSRDRASRVVPFAVFALLFLCLPAPASAQWATNGDNINNTNTGNVGVGTAAPAAKLHVNGDVRVEAPGGVLSVRNTSSWTQIIAGRSATYQAAFIATPSVPYSVANPYWAMGFSPDGSTGWSLDTWDGANMNTRLRVLAGSGNVGIGTQTPEAKLHVLGTGRFSGPGAGLNVRNTDGWSQIIAQRTGGMQAAFIAVPAVPYNVNNPYWAMGLSSDGSAGWSLDTWDGASIVNRVRVVPSSGNVGIGTAAPATKLHVAGDITVDGNINAKYQDVAEWVPSTQKLAPGTVVILDPERPNHVLASTSSYDTAVAGVISGRPGLTLGEAGVGKVLVATTGRVKVRVDATRGPIRIGDLIVTSDVEGVAMRSEPMTVGGRKFHSPGTIIGKALEPLAGGTGEILVLLSLQ